MRIRDNHALGKMVGVLLCAGAFGFFIFVVLSHRSLYLTRFDPNHADKVYQSSQWNESQNISEDKTLDEWAIKSGYTGWKNYMDVIVTQTKIESQKAKIVSAIRSKGVSDSFLYSYVGYRYVTGTAPQLLNPEHPPLAKYLIGLSILYLHNENCILILVGFLTLILVGILTYLMSHSIVRTGCAVLLTSTSTLFIDQLIHGPQLELFQLFFFLCLVLTLTLAQQSSHKFSFTILSGIFYGCMLATKTVFPFLLLTTVWLLFMGKWNIKYRATIWVIGVTVFTFSYLAYFMQGGTVRGFLGVQKYIVVFYQNAHIPLSEFIGNYLRLIFTGYWKFWDTMRSVSRYSEWNVSWPLLFVLGMTAVFRKRTKMAGLAIFIILYNGFLLVTPMFPRYLVLLYVPMFIVMCV